MGRMFQQFSAYYFVESFQVWEVTQPWNMPHMLCTRFPAGSIEVVLRKVSTKRHQRYFIAMVKTFHKNDKKLAVSWPDQLCKQKCWKNVSRNANKCFPSEKALSWGKRGKYGSSVVGTVYELSYIYWSVVIKACRRDHCNRFLNPIKSISAVWTYKIKSVTNVQLKISCCLFP